MFTLLLVDDDPDVLATLRRTFRREYKTLTATGGAEAIEIIDKHSVNMIICDQRMPDISGDDVLQHALAQQPEAIRILLTGYADMESLIKCVNQAQIYKYISKPWDPENLKLTVQRALESQALKQQLDKAHKQLETAYRDTVVMLCTAAEGKDKDTGSHLFRVQFYTESLAKALGIEEAQAEHMGLMSMLHDIGKLFVPDAILKKTSKLEADEWEIMQQHPLNGAKILGQNPFYKIAREIAAGHHENFDGTGYPQKLAGEDIPLSARIVKIADVFDALTSKRAYKDAWTMADAMAFIKTESGKMFDPAIVTQLDYLHQQGELQAIADRVEQGYNPEDPFRLSE